MISNKTADPSPLQRYVIHGRPLQNKYETNLTIYLVFLLQIIGYIIVAVTFLLQPLMKWACERLEGFARVLVADIFLFTSFVGTVNVWRGVWQLLDIYFLPGELIFVTLFLSFLITLFSPISLSLSHFLFQTFYSLFAFSFDL